MAFITNAGALWHRLWSVRMAILGVLYSSAGGAWLLMPPDWQPSLSEHVKWALAIVGVMLAASPGISALVAQPKAVEKAAEKVAAKKPSGAVS